MILEEGTHKFTCGESPDYRWASASSPGLMTVVVKRNGVAEDKVYVMGPTHTWWSHNPLFDPPLRPKDQIEIELAGPGAMRLECGGID